MTKVAEAQLVTTRLTSRGGLLFRGGEMTYPPTDTCLPALQSWILSHQFLEGAQIKSAVQRWVSALQRWVLALQSVRKFITFPLFSSVKKVTAQSYSASSAELASQYLELTLEPILQANCSDQQQRCF